MSSRPIFERASAPPRRDRSDKAVSALPTRSGWFAARPSGTESIYKIYAESFLDDEHLDRIAQEAQAMVDGPLRVAPLTP